MDDKIIIDRMEAEEFLSIVFTSFGGLSPGCPGDRFRMAALHHPRRLR